MSLMSLMSERLADGRPLRVGLIGADKFAALFLAQARHLPTLHVAAIAHPDIERAHTALALAMWPPAKAVARSLAEAFATGGTWVADDTMAMLEQPGLDVVIEATNSPQAASNALAAMANDTHVIMASIEADALVGPYLARQARLQGVIYSLAYGDQPSLICEMVDWARACGFQIAAAGRGIAWKSGHETITPDQVWSHLDITPEQARAKDLDPRVATASLDGTRTALELASVCNATGLLPPTGGLTCPPCGTHDLPHVFRPTADGGRLEGMGVVEAASCLEPDGRGVHGGLRWGVFATFTSPSPHTTLSFAEYGLLTDASGCYAARWRPHRLAGMEATLSVASVCLRGEHTGCPRDWIADVATIAKTNLPAGSVLDGIGGTSVRGILVSSAQAMTTASLPVSLTPGAVLRRPVAAGQAVTLADVDLPSEVGHLMDMRAAMVPVG